MVADNKNISAVNADRKDATEILFEKYVKSTIRTLGSTDFYETFMEAMASAQTEIQFSNRRMEKIVDTQWVDAVESALSGFQHIIENPRNIIREDELIVNVENAKKTGSDVVRHLATHASLIEDFDEYSGDVQPKKVMQKYREDSIGQVYENRVVFTTLEMAYQFVKIRYDALFEVMSDEFGAKLKFKTDIDGSTENIHMDMFLHIKDIDGALEVDDKNREIFDRISRLYRILSFDMNSHFAKHMSKYPRIKGTVTKTNVLKKNKNYHAILELLEFLKGYRDIGYTIKIIEQNPEVDEKFQENIFRNTMFQYLLLKSHLEKDKDRRLLAPAKSKKRTLKPKFIKEIIEELTEDYDLPDIEIRKVLIEELTKEQLMREEKAERERLVKEQEEKKKAEKERIRKEKEAEKEKRRREREEEKERRRLEKEAEEQRLYFERMEKEQEDRRRTNFFKKDIQKFLSDFDERLAERQQELVQESIALEDFEDAAYIAEQAERLKKEEADIKRQRRRDEILRMRIREQEEKERAIREAEEAKQDEIRRQEEARALSIIEEQLRLQKEKEKRELEDLKAVECFANEVAAFKNIINANLSLRFQQELNEKHRADEFLAERQKRIDARNSDKKTNWRTER